MSVSELRSIREQILQLSKKSGDDFAVKLSQQADDLSQQGLSKMRSEARDALVEKVKNLFTDYKVGFERLVPALLDQKKELESIPEPAGLIDRQIFYQKIPVLDSIYQNADQKTLLALYDEARVGYQKGQHSEMLYYLEEVVYPRFVINYDPKFKDFISVIKANRESRIPPDLQKDLIDIRELGRFNEYGLTFERTLDEESLRRLFHNAGSQVPLSVKNLFKQ